jgi:hypothetical protein
MRHMYFDLSRNGLATGIDANVREIQIPIEQSATANLVYDVVCFYTRILQINDGEMKVMV